MIEQRLPSWIAGRPSRDTVLGYLDSIDDIPIADRVAYLDNDGTMWCERPRYIQYEFFVDELRHRTTVDPSLADRPEFAAVLNSDLSALADLGLGAIALALASLFDNRTPAEFEAAVANFATRYQHPQLDRSVVSLVYQPMRELLDELRAHDFTIGIVTGGGTEFVRSLSQPLYGVPAERVVGTMVGYRFERDDDAQPRLRRSSELMGRANEGAAKVEHIQSQLGRAPIFTVGNSGGDREMLEWATAGAHPGLAVLIDHDDAEREFAYQSTAATFQDDVAITEVAAQLGWVTVSMHDDWSTIFAPG